MDARQIGQAFEGADRIMKIDALAILCNRNANLPAQSSAIAMQSYRLSLQLMHKTLKPFLKHALAAIRPQGSAHTCMIASNVSERGAVLLP